MVLELVANFERARETRVLAESEERFLAEFYKTEKERAATVEEDMQ